MPAVKLHIFNERMLSVMAFVQANNMKGITTKEAFMQSIGSIGRNLSNITSGKQSFTPEQIRMCCAVYGITADYIFGFTDKMFASKVKMSPLERIKEAVAELEKKPVNTRKSAAAMP